MGLVVVTGAGGLLGREVARELAERGREVRALDRHALDVTDAEMVRKTFASLRPELVVHCAALTNVDECEESPDRAFAVNEDGAGNVARAAEDVGADVVAVSTDYVFDGTKGSPYTESDEPNPIQTYGASKLAGEERVRELCPRHYIVRSAWIYGPGGKNFLSKLPEMASSGSPIRAVVDQRGSPTYAPDLAGAIAALAGTGSYGTYHVANAGGCTFAEFCRHALAALGARTEVEEVRLADLGRAAPRPADTRLACQAWTGAGPDPLRPWTDASAAFCASVRTSVRAAEPTDPLR